ALHAILLFESDVLILDLDCKRNQHSVACDLHKISADIKRHYVVVDLGGDDLFKVLELYGGGLVQHREGVQTIKLLALIALRKRTRSETFQAAGKAVSHQDPLQRNAV